MMPQLLLLMCSSPTAPGDACNDPAPPAYTLLLLLLLLLLKNL
jgi:hypothetical protein